MEASTLSAQLAEFHQQGRALLQEQTRALDATIGELQHRDPNHVSPSVWIPMLMLQAVGVSVHSVLALTQERTMAIRDGFGIARSAVETAINAAFISVEGDSMGERAIRHMRQKRWRDLNRETQIGDLHIATSRDIEMNIDDFPGLRDAVDEFTRKRGTEVREWVDTSLEDRISAISARSRRGGLGLGSAYFGIYRPASELLHGSYYGVNFFWQGSRATRARNAQEFEYIWVMEYFVLLLSALFLGVGGAIDAISEVLGLADQKVQQDLLSRRLQKLIEAMGDVDPDDEHRFSAVVRRTSGRA